MAKVSYLCKRTVVSTKPVDPGKFYQLSVLDRAMELYRLRLVYYYLSSTSRELGEATKILRESISTALSCFPIMTGRLQRNNLGHWMIKCNDAGVRMVEARANGSVEEWLQHVDREKELKLVHWEDMSHKPYFWSTFYVQLTEFVEGGLAIGLSCTHLLSDPICATMFVKAWADITLIGKMTSPPLFHPLPCRRPESTSYKPYNNLIDHYRSHMSKPITISHVKHVTVTFAFTDNMVRACMAACRTTCIPDGSTPSSFEALAGLFWVSISKVKGVRKGLIDMSISLDVRKVLNLDKGYFGNCMVYNKVEGESLDKNKLSDAAKAIGEVVGKMDAEGVNNLIEWLQTNCDHQALPVMNGHDLICANLECMESYSTVFEDGFDPLQVSCYIEPVIALGQVFILPSPGGEGPLSRRVMVTLDQDEAIRVSEDSLILSFSPTILMRPTELPCPF